MDHSEGGSSTFFTFLPGFWKSFGTSLNGVVNLTKYANPTFDRDGNSTYVFAQKINVSKFTYNVIGFFESGGVNLRVAYNWRSRRQLEVNTGNPYLNRFLDPIERLDASVTYDVTKNLTIALQADNLTKSGDQQYFGSYDYPQQIRFFARNYSASIRARF